MVKKRDLVIAVLITFCLTSTMFLVQIVRSQTLGQYDPWLDIDDSGKIDVYDVARVAKAFGTSGDPTKNVNVTNWEVDCYHKYSVEIAIDIGNASVGNAQPIECYVHVTYQGLPIMGLMSDNFQTATIASPFGGQPAGIAIYFNETTTAAGCYQVECKPFGGQQWATGTYVFYIGVRNPAPPASSVYNGVTMTSFKL